MTCEDSCGTFDNRKKTEDNNEDRKTEDNNEDRRQKTITKTEDNEDNKRQRRFNMAQKVKNEDIILKVLAGKEAPVSASDIAREVKSSRQTVRSTLLRLQKKGKVGGEGAVWALTNTGEHVLNRGEADKEEEDKGEGESGPTTVSDAGLDEISKFVLYGQISDLKPNEIACALAIFKEGDMQSMQHFDSVMAQAHIPMLPRDKWRNMYLSYLRLGTPLELKDKLYPLPAVQFAAVIPGTEDNKEDKKTGDTRDYIVEGFDIHRPGEDLGEFTFKEALQAVAAKRGTTPTPTPPPNPQDGSSSLKDLAEAIRILNPDPAKPITYESLLGLVREIDELRGGRGSGGDKPAPGYYIDSDGNKNVLAPGEPVVIIHQPPAPAPAGKNYFFNPETQKVEEVEQGKPIVVTIKQGGAGDGQVPFPVFDNNNQPVFDKDGKPVVTNLEPMMRWIGFREGERRSNERHDALLGLYKTAKDNVGDFVSSLSIVAKEDREDKRTSKKVESPTLYRCGECHAEFSPPQGWSGQNIKCPNSACGREYTKEELEG